MTMPNFLIIGAMKAGTSAMFHSLATHPQVYGKQKEPHFFSFVDEIVLPIVPVVTNLNDYKALFVNVTGEIAIGEASPSYLVHPRAAGRIKQFIPDAKLIAILRHPVARAYSQYWHHIQSGEENCKDFLEAFFLDDERRTNTTGLWWDSYRYQGLYSQHLERYLSLFDREQLKIILYDDFCAKQKETITDLYRFLNVDDTIDPQIMRYWATGKPRSRTLHNLLRRPNSFMRLARYIVPRRFSRRFLLYLHNKNVVKTPISREVYERLLPEFREDVLKLQELLGRDLSGWLELPKLAS